VDPIASRREVAGSLGADAVVDRLDRLAAEPGDFDIVVDCSGASSVPNAAMELTRPGGRILLVGFPPHPGTLDYKTLLLKELSLVASVGHVYDEDFATAVRLLCSGRIDAAPLISHRIPFERAVSEGIERLAGPGRAQALKILVRPGD